MVKNLPAMQGTMVQSLGQEDLEEWATHSGILARRILRTEEPNELQSSGSKRVGHNGLTNTFTSLSLLTGTLLNYRLKMYVCLCKYKTLSFISQHPCLINNN